MGNYLSKQDLEIVFLFLFVLESWGENSSGGKNYK